MKFSRQSVLKALLITLQMQVIPEQRDIFRDFLPLGILDCLPIFQGYIEDSKFYIHPLLWLFLLDFIDIDDHKILRTIRNLNPNEAHGCDDISIRMLKICDDSIVLPMCHIFIKYLEFQTFSTLWKGANTIPIHKKQSRQLIKNYRLIYLLPICGKIFENYFCLYLRTSLQ